MDLTTFSFAAGILGSLAAVFSTVVALRSFRRDAASARQAAADTVHHTNEELLGVRQRLVIAESRIDDLREQVTQARGDITYYRNLATDLQVQLNNWRHDHEA